MSAIALKAELALFISLFKHLSKTLQGDFDDIQAMESILEEADEERICDIEPKADGVRVSLKIELPAKEPAISAWFAVTEC